MAIKSLLSAHRTNLETATPGDRDDRFFLDFRQLEYADLGTGSAQYTVAREDNLIDRGNCEAPIAPMIFGETVPLLSNATLARSSDFAHTGTYSYKAIKTNGDGGEAATLLTDSASTTAFHGIVPGASYELTAWAYAPTASGIAAAECKVIFWYYESGA